MRNYQKKELTTRTNIFSFATNITTKKHLYMCSKGSFNKESIKLLKMQVLQHALVSNSHNHIKRKEVDLATKGFRIGMMRLKERRKRNVDGKMRNDITKVKLCPLVKATY